VDAVRLIVRAAFRHRWRSWVALAALVAVVGGVTLGAAAAGERTARAYPSFLRLHGFDWAVATRTPADVAAIPGVTSAVEAPYDLNGQPTCRCTHPIDGNALSIVSVGSRTLGHLVNLVSGRMPNSSNPDEVLASFTLQRDDGVHLGTLIRIPMYAPSQQQAVLDSTGLGPATHGPTILLKVVGIEASVTEFPSGINPSGSTATYDLYTSQAFADHVLPKIAVYYQYFVDLRHPAAESLKFKKTVTAMGVLDQTQLDTPSSLEAGAIHPQAMGWWLLALLAALAGTAVVGQAVSRQVFVESEDNATLVALGVSPRQLGAAALAAATGAAVAGGVGSVAIAYLVSPFAPAGVARYAEPSTGFMFDTPVLVLGGLSITVVVLILAIWPAIRAAHSRRDEVPPSHPSAVSHRLSQAGAPPSVVIGVRHALERGSGRAASPVATAILGTVLAVAALCGTAVFAASLSRLGSDASLYGDDYQLIVYALNTSSSIAKVQRTPGIAAISLGTSSRIEINHVFTTSFVTASLRGPELLSVVEGSLPTKPNQIALGAATMHQSDVHVGSLAHVVVGQPNGGTRTETLHVTGVVAFPTGVADDQAGLGDGADLSLSMFCPSTGPAERCPLVARSQNSFALLVRVAPGRAGRAAVAKLEADFPGQTATPVEPTGLVNFGEAVDFPLIFGVMLGVFGAATLAHLLVVSIGRRRVEMGLLKSLGFLRRQVAAAVYWQTATVTMLGLVIGTTVGIAAGREVWIGFARNIGVVPVPVVDTLTTVLLLTGVVVAAAVLAVAPALAAARARPSEVLHAQ
jgi:hypothetical protein